MYMYTVRVLNFVFISVLHLAGGYQELTGADWSAEAGSGHVAPPAQSQDTGMSSSI